MKIGFDFICDESLLFADVAEILFKDGHVISGITMGKRWFSGRRKNFNYYDINNSFENLKNIEENLIRIESVYGKYSPASFVLSDRFISKLDRKTQTKYLLNTFIEVENYVNDAKIDVFISTGIAYLYNLVTLAVCEKYNIRHISLYSTRSSDDNFTFSYNTGSKWDLVEQEYYKICDSQTISGEIDIAKSYLSMFRNKMMAPSYMNTARQSYNFNINQFKEFIVRIKHWYIDGWRTDKYDYITKSPYWYAFRDVKKILLAKYINLNKNFIYDQLNDDCKYYIYPLHLQPEASTLIHAKWYVDQINTILNISKTLPLDAVLYVKEHKSAIGRHTLNFYKKLKSIHNVRLISYDVDVRKFINNCKGIVVLSGTMGWEAYLLNKPVFVLGDVFYDFLPGIYKIRSFEDLRSKITVAESTNIVNNDESIVNFLIALKRKSFPGLFDVTKMDTANKVLSRKNIENVYVAINDILSN
ncbi:MAG: hypothetical protein AB7U43_04025 [Desulfobacter sp.]